MPVPCATRCSRKPSFLTTSRRAMTATHLCGPPLVRTVLETRFAKPSAGDGFGEPVGRKREHNTPVCKQCRMMASTRADNSSRTLPASGRKREQGIGLFASKRRYYCKRLQLPTKRQSSAERLPSRKRTFLNRPFDTCKALKCRASAKVSQLDGFDTGLPLYRLIG